MKKLLLLIAFYICLSPVFSQDLIVTDKNDSINCKITKVRKDNVYFTFRHKNEIRSTLLPVAETKHYQFNYFKNIEVPPEKVIDNHIYKHFRIALNGGYGYRTNKMSSTIPSDFSEYSKKLKNGYEFGGDLTYYFTEPLGIGIKYSSFKASNSMSNIYIEDSNGNRRYGNMSDNIGISFIGPVFSMRFLNKNKTNALLMNVALGYMGYKNKYTVVDPYELTSSTTGIAYDIGYDFTLSSNLILGVQLSAISGVLTGYKLYDGSTTQNIELQKENYEGLNRLELSLGLRFMK
jgi:hypothetical protein